jgi:hypothetical protein
MKKVSARKLDLRCLEKEPNTFEIRDMDNKLISNSCEDLSNGLEDGQTATFYFVGLTESMYTNKNPKKPMTCNVTGTPSFEIIEYLYKKKKMSIMGIFTLYLRMCEDCINELESIAKGEVSYKRTAGTECDFCKEILKLV